MIRAGQVVECVEAKDKRLHLSLGMTYRVRLVIGGMIAIEDLLGPINTLFQHSRFEVAKDQSWNSGA